MSHLNENSFYEIQDYKFCKCIGKGRLSSVWLVYKKNEDKYCAAKVLEKFGCSMDVKRFFNNEISILSSLEHYNIVRYYDNKEISFCYILFMEYCSGNSLLSCLKKYISMYHKTFNEEIIQQIMKQIVNGLKYLHEKNIIHRDLKTENIFVKFYNKENYNNMNLDKTHIKIGDFGFSTKEKNFLTIAGTPVYMDPIILKKYNERTNKENSEMFDKSCDIWSLGVICFELVTGKRLFNGKDIDELYQNVQNGDYEIPINLSEEIVSFINGMLQYDPKKRLTIEQLSNHRFLTKKVKDFKKIPISLVRSKIQNDKLKINIIKNESIWGIFNEYNFLRSISSGYFMEYPKGHQPNVNVRIFPLQSGVKGHLHHKNNKNEINNQNNINQINTMNTQKTNLNNSNNSNNSNKIGNYNYQNNFGIINNQLNLNNPNNNMNMHNIKSNNNQINMLGNQYNQNYFNNNNYNNNINQIRNINESNNINNNSQLKNPTMISNHINNNNNGNNVRKIRRIIY